MGNPRGRKPKHPHLKAVEGNPGKRPIKKNYLKAPAGAPDPPKSFSLGEKSAFVSICRHLDELGILVKTDRLIISLAAQVWARVLESKRVLAEEGVYQKSKTKTGGTITRRHPAMATLEVAEKELRQILSTLGLDPIARTRISTGDDQADMFADFASGQQG